MISLPWGPRLSEIGCTSNDVFPSEKAKRKVSAVAEFYRTEIRASENSEQGEDRPKFVVIVEIPEKVVASAGNLSPAQLETTSYEIALDATQAERLNNPSFQSFDWSSTQLIGANADAYGDPDFTSEDGCRAWIVEAP